jgi:hypothetical protein
LKKVRLAVRLVNASVRPKNTSLQLKSLTHLRYHGCMLNILIFQLSKKAKWRFN